MLTIGTSLPDFELFTLFPHKVDQQPPAAQIFVGRGPFLENDAHHY